jgi:hypothetical protein
MALSSSTHPPDIHKLYFAHYRIVSPDMIIVISPAKTLDLSEDTRYLSAYSQPELLDESNRLINQLMQLDLQSLGELMHLSDELAQLNYERFQTFNTPFSPKNAKQALFTFNGDVYVNFELATYQKSEFDYAQQHLRILSGLYGLLRPLDLIQPYRLEMGTSLRTERGKNLYDFWGERITNCLKVDIAAQGATNLVNLASQEYFKAIHTHLLGVRVITPQFKEIRDGQAKTIAIYAKQARGLMCNFAIKEGIKNPEALKTFTGMGYHYDDSLSDLDTWVFARETQE